jgi:hypothetical protein
MYQPAGGDLNITSVGRPNPFKASLNFSFSEHPNWAQLSPFSRPFGSKENALWD